ncbi:tetratricopeptide repeat protein [Candidatus Similichlamydia laticola]|uniref:Putative type III secretion chaperone n=1 Tax=Candidatus Similichlamydia laticola TaxID=2170265 RepID=A0A369KAW5_9BACT|nr:tetratricopeptide repeat protein [Candidatus Similichlamydia laticola]RDB31751.1 putative type III secretion chaperone [Candidatus Similichlamydia laticola]
MKDGDKEIVWRDLLGFSDEQIQDLRFTGYFYIRQGKYEIAKSFFEALVIFQSQEMPSKQEVYDFKTLGALYLELGKYRRALRYLDRALQFDAEDWTVRLNRLYCLFSLNKIEEGLEAAEELRNSQLPQIAGAAEALVSGWREQLAV